MPVASHEVTEFVPSLFPLFIASNKSGNKILNLINKSAVWLTCASGGVCVQAEHNYHPSTPRKRNHCNCNCYLTIFPTLPTAAGTVSAYLAGPGPPGHVSERHINTLLLVGSLQAHMALLRAMDAHPNVMEFARMWCALNLNVPTQRSLNKCDNILHF